MNRISEERQRLLIANIAQGHTIRGTAIALETNIPTILRNTAWVAEACQQYHDQHARNLKCAFIECDELFSNIYAKEDNLPEGLKGFREVGDMWTYGCMCAETRFMITWRIGKHIPSDVQIFTDDIASRIPDRVQIHSDQLNLYRRSFESSFGARASYATTRKTMDPATKTPDGQFEQVQFDEARVRSEFGEPDLEKVTTNHLERFHATLRTWNRAYARRTLAFNKKIKNAEQRLAINYFYYNFVHQQECLDGITPAMALGVTDKLWSIRDMARLVPERKRKNV